MHRRTLLALMGGAALQGCVAAPPVVTRSAPDPFEGGIGGTGIVGVLTDFGSLLVNGLRVELDSRTRYSTPFGPVSDGALAPGQSLTITAVQSRDRLVARSVRIDHALIGRLGGSGGHQMVNGTPLHLEVGAIIDAAPGQMVAVSGVWRRDGLSVSRIDPADSLNDGFDKAAPDLIAGTFDRGGPTGARIGGQAVRLTGPAPAAGSYLVGRGRFDGRVMQVSLTREGRFDPRATLDQLSVEGYLEPTATAPRFRIAGLGHSFGRNLRLSPLAPHRALYFGRYDGLFQAANGYVMPDSFAQRRDLLRDGVSPQDGQRFRTLG